MTIDTILGIIGIGLAAVGIGLSLFLYFHDVRTRLDKIIKQLGVLVAEHHVDFVSIESDFAKSRIELLEKQDDRLKKFYDDIYGRLVLIEHHQEGVMTRDQALQLTNLYLDSVTTHLDLELQKFCEVSLPSKYKLKQTEKIMNELVNSYDATVRRSIRPMVSPFVLRSGQSFYDLISSINTDAIALGFREIETNLKQLISKKQDPQQYVDVVKRVLRSVSESGRLKILEKVESAYPPTPKK